MSVDHDTPKKSHLFASPPASRYAESVNSCSIDTYHMYIYQWICIVCISIYPFVYISICICYEYIHRYTHTHTHTHTHTQRLRDLTVCFPRKRCTRIICSCSIRTKSSLACCVLPTVQSKKRGPNLFSSPEPPHFDTPACTPPSQLSRRRDVARYVILLRLICV